MDFRLGLLLHTLNGLELSGSELIRLLRLSPDEVSMPDRVVEVLDSEAAKGFVGREKDWWRVSARTLEASGFRGIRWSYLGQADYPRGWYDLSLRPTVFSYLGQPVWSEWPLISIVGSRLPTTDTSLWLQRELSRFLRRCRVAVVSGGARGVDQWAHGLSLAESRPTVCVFPSGLLRPYPPERESLWRNIVEGGGALLSTFALDRPMRKAAFHVRNRWIAGLSQSTFIVEANRRSGSELTARLALYEQREIATLPVGANAAQGLANLDLLAAGAQLIRDAGDLVAFFERTGALARPTGGVALEPSPPQ